MYSFEDFLLDKEKSNINGALLNVTDQCNCRCKYCDFVKYKNSFMSKEVAEQALKFLTNLSKTKDRKLNIAFFGGEPLLNFSLIEYIVTKYTDQYSWSITTNGTLLTKEIIDFLYEYDINILLSFDGNKETQDFNRPMINGNSSFDAVEPFFPYLIEKFPCMTFRSTLYPPTSKNMSENYFFAMSKGFQHYYSTPDEYSEWDEESIQNLRNGLTSIVVSYIYGIENQYPFTRFSELDRFLVEFLVQKDQPNQFKYDEGIFRCGLGLTSLGIGTTGQIYACQEHSSTTDKDDIFFIGNIFDGIDDQKHYNLISTYIEQHLHAFVQPNKCLTCPANYICHSTRCPSRNYFISKDFDHCSSIRCAWTKIMHEAAQQLNSYFEYHYSKNYEYFIERLLSDLTHNSYKLEKDMVIL